PELINTYIVVRDHVEELIGQLQKLEKEYFSRPESLRKDHFLKIRSEEAADPVSRAARMIYLNRTCYNGLYRVNRKGQFNVPFGRYRRPAICDERRLRLASKALQDKHITVRDFRTVINFAGRGDFIYFDPPYHPLNETAYFTAYTDAGFNERDQRDLALVARELVKKGCKVMISNADTPFIREIYHGFRFIEIKARRNINCRPDRRGIINELLILSY
ncbi:MAG: Dam family site-specific DNA-(adenine-N6)-methyltransferase, partial [Moorella sp. (in: Bacteria)]|nr:Dam family site-specific DNA-(adenine-N6)-methyltransferase [Moorella sp. (in: firmicutes)]